MISFEEVKRYLPQYLSVDAQTHLFEELKHYPENIDSRLFTSYLKDKSNLFQGDGLKNVLYINLPDPAARPVSAMILSNTCDLSAENKRIFQMRMVYTPIINLDKYSKLLMSKHEPQKVDQFVSDIKKQYISNIFYIPKNEKLENDSIVFFDRINSMPIKSIEALKIREDRLFTLSDYGFYLFLFKLSVHFTRIREGVDRRIDPPIN